MAIAAEHNADNAKVLFDHINIDNAGSIPSSQATRWLIACQTFALGGGNSDLGYTKSGPSATAIMVLPMGKTLHDTLMLSLVPENKYVVRDDIPVWERPQQEEEKAITGFADLYSWRTRSIKFNVSEDGKTVSQLAFASGCKCLSSNCDDPMLGYIINHKKGKQPIRFKERGFWRDFDSLLPTQGNDSLAPKVIEHAINLTRSHTSRFPKSVLVLGQASDQAKVKYWRMERFALPESASLVIVLSEQKSGNFSMPHKRLEIR